MRSPAPTPALLQSEILETLASFREIDAQWSVNEKVACEVAPGAAIGGARSLVACKHGGQNKDAADAARAPGA